MKLSELYSFLNESIPPSLSADWDNDGIMFAPDGEKQVKKVLLALDANLPTARKAIEEKADLVITHHPLLFHPVSHLSFADKTQNALSLFAASGIPVFSFHTRLDAVENGVNDILADLFGIRERHFLCEVGRAGVLKNEMPSDAFARLVGEKLGSDRLSFLLPRTFSHKIAFVGGSGRHCLPELIDNGIDTFVTGETSFDEENAFFDAGINLICAGHYFTEAPVLHHLKDLLLFADPNLFVSIFNSNVMNGGSH